MVGKDLCDSMREFFGAKQFLKEIKSTLVFPKKIGADSPDQFRPISLCNSFYKIISKVLTSRFLLVLPSLISDQQNGFIPGRQILNSIIAAHENIHSLSCSNNQGFIMKIDIAKANDKVEWAFLAKILQAFGFDHKIVGAIYQLISTSSIFVLVNGSSSHFFNPSRGLRQGDPLSPILFVIMADCLGRYIRDLVQKGVIKGLQPSSHPLTCSHSQFVDDTIFMGKSKVNEARNLNQALNLYSSTSGQLVNWNKSVVFFINTLIPR